MFFANFVIVYIKMIFDLYSLFLDDHMVQGTSKSQRGEKYIFHFLGDECCPKRDFEKLTCQSCDASPI